LTPDSTFGVSLKFWRFQRPEIKFIKTFFFRYCQKTLQLILQQHQLLDAINNSQNDCQEQTL
jgi:hypothetical protein